MVLPADPGFERTRAKTSPGAPKRGAKSLSYSPFFDVKITRNVQIQQISSPVPFARQWNQNVRSSILIMIVTCSQTGANGSSRSSLWHSERAENWAPWSRPPLTLFSVLLEEEVTDREAVQTLDGKRFVSSSPECVFEEFFFFLLQFANKTVLECTVDAGNAANRKCLKGLLCCRLRACVTV